GGCTPKAALGRRTEALLAFADNHRYLHAESCHRLCSNVAPALLLLGRRTKHNTRRYKQLPQTISAVLPCCGRREPPFFLFAARHRDSRHTRPLPSCLTIRDFHSVTSQTKQPDVVVRLFTRARRDGVKIRPPHDRNVSPASGASQTTTASLCAFVRCRRDPRPCRGCSQTDPSRRVRRTSCPPASQSQARRRPASRRRGRPSARGTAS